MADRDSTERSDTRAGREKSAAQQEFLDKKLQGHREKGGTSRAARRDDDRAERAGSRGDLPGATAPWVVPTMLALLVLGVIWIVVFYLAGPLIPFMAPLGNWNLAVGMGMIAASFVVATQWK